MMERCVCWYGGGIGTMETESVVVGAHLSDPSDLGGSHM